MWPFDDRMIEIHKTFPREGRPAKTYQWVRPLSKKSYRYAHDPAPRASVIHQRLSPATQPIVSHRRPSPELKPIKDTFKPREGEDLPLAPYPGGRGQADNFHPLPPLIHQPSPPPLTQPYNNHNNPNFIEGLAPHLNLQNNPHHRQHHRQHRHPHHPNNGRHSTHPLAGNSTPFFDETPGYSNAVVRPASPPSSRGNVTLIRGSDGRYYHHPSSSSNYSSSSRTSSGYRSCSSDSADSWDGDTLKSEFGGYAGSFDEEASWDECGRVERVRKGGRGYRRIDGDGRGRLRLE